MATKKIYIPTTPEATQCLDGKTDDFDLYHRSIGRYIPYREYDILDCDIREKNTVLYLDVRDMVEMRVGECEHI